jgi:hypothetical protein
MLKKGVVKSVSKLLSKHCIRSEIIDSKGRRLKNPNEEACKKTNDLFIGILKCFELFSLQHTYECASQVTAY